MPSELPPILNHADPRTVARAVKDISLFLGLDRARPIALPESDGTNPRTVTIQTVDRVGQYKNGRFWFRLMFGTAPFTRSSGMTITIVSAAANFSPVANEVIECLTDEDGSIELEIDYVGTWYITASIGMEAFNMGENASSAPAGPGTPGSPMGLLLALTYP